MIAILPIGGKFVGIGLIGVVQIQIFIFYAHWSLTEVFTLIIFIAAKK